MAMGSYSPQLARTIPASICRSIRIKGYSLTIPIGNHQAPRRSARWTRRPISVAISRFGDRVRVTATAEFATYDASHRPEDFAFMKVGDTGIVSGRRGLHHRAEM